MDVDPDQYEQSRRAKERQPQENAFSEAVREMQPRPEGTEQVKKPEVQLDQFSKLNPEQKAVAGLVVREMKTWLTMVDDGLKAMDRQLQQTPEYQRDSFKQWHSTYCDKMLADLGRNMQELAGRIDCTFSVPVQCFGEKGNFPETFRVSIPPKVEDLALHGCNAVVKVHSDNPEREKDLKTQTSPDKYVSGWELVYWMMRRGGLTRQKDVLSA